MNRGGGGPVPRDDLRASPVATRQAALKLIGDVKTAVYMAYFGWTSLKPLALLCTHAVDTVRMHVGFSKLDASAALAASGAYAPLTSVGPRQSKRPRGGSEAHTGWRSHGWVNRSRDLAKSREYPSRFSEAMCAIIATGLSAP